MSDPTETDIALAVAADLARDLPDVSQVQIAIAVVSAMDMPLRRDAPLDRASVEKSARARLTGSVARRPEHAEPGSR